MNTRVLMSDAAHFSAEAAINPYYFDPTVDAAKAEAELASIQNALEASGVDVIRVASPPESQDGVYTANWALVRGNTAVLARLPAVRSSEEQYAKGYLEALGLQVVTVPEDWKFSGQGDALPCGDMLFCGQQYRSDPRAQQFAAETLGLRRIQLQTVPQLDESGQAVTNAVSGWPDSFFYDIDLALAVIREPQGDQKGLIAYCPDAFTEESRTVLAALDEVDRITVSYEEATHAFATNLVSTGSSVIMSARAPLLKQALENHGLTVITPDVTELSKGGGYIRCTTLTIA